MADMTTPFQDPFAARLPGGSVTLRRKVPFLHVGGPADGGFQPVEVDENGEPVEFYTLNSFTSPNPGVDPADGLAADFLHALYERDERFGDEGFEYVFRFRGQDVIEAPKAA
jgi:hypothetical protein